MLIQRIIPHRIITKRILPLTVALMASVPALGSSQTRYDNGSDELIIKEQVVEPKIDDDMSEQGFPWMHVIAVGFLALFGGVCALGNYVDKKFNENEAEPKEDSAVKPDNQQ